MSLHHDLHNDLSNSTQLMQFFYKLTWAFHDQDKHTLFCSLNDTNVALLLAMRDQNNWEGQHDQVIKQLSLTKEFTGSIRGLLKLQQTGTDEQIIKFIQQHDQFFTQGIELNDLSQLFDISHFFADGYMLHDRFAGYNEENYFITFHVDCLDYVHNAAHFYNEAYDYWKGYKTVKTYEGIPAEEIGMYEMRRIQSRDEIMARNFREAYLNIILFMESFINSVGYDAFLGRNTLDQRDALKLKGIQGQRANGRYNYSTLEQKVQNISWIIYGTELNTDNEPFYSYLQTDVQLRNCYVHSKPGELPAITSIEGWKNKCDEMIARKTETVLHAFWKGCYPDKPFPGNIFNVFHGNSFKGHQGKMVTSRANH